MPKNSANSALNGGFLANCSQGRGGDFDFLAGAVFKFYAHGAQVWQETLFGFVVRVADIVAHERPFARDLTHS